MDADRAFFRDVLGFSSVDAGSGWLIFALPPSELAAHPTEERDHHELYLMCDDVQATISELEDKGVEITRPISDEGSASLPPSGSPAAVRLGLYEPRHPSPLD